MYILPQAGRILHDALVQHLKPYGHRPSNKTPGPWKYDSHPINFTVVVDDFGVKYSVKKHDLHLKSALEDKYKVTTDWEVKLYTGISLRWEYEKVTVQISIPGYIYAALHLFQQQKQKTTRFTIPLDPTYLCKE